MMHALFQSQKVERFFQDRVIGDKFLLHFISKTRLYLNLSCNLQVPWIDSYKTGSLWELFVHLQGWQSYLFDVDVLDKIPQVQLLWFSLMFVQKDFLCHRRDGIKTELVILASSIYSPASIQMHCRRMM